jgi:acetylornithine deacetylase/succinyl-diaminopimelate desuccinylase-like protein
VDELAELVRVPSVSGRPEHAAGVRRCAEQLAAELRRIGLEGVELLPGARHPAVVARGHAEAGRPTVLVYGHYDVQPAEPLEHWRTAPFDPVVRGGHLLGRGAADDKGQLLAHVKALESYLATPGRLPVNIICLFEGEEEIGSPGLGALLARHRDRLRADVAAMSDTRMLAPDRPAITYALRGSLGIEVEVEGPPRELHSGNFGGAVHDPVQALCAIVDTLADREGRVAVPGFYDRVRRWNAAERERMRRTWPSDRQILRDAGVDRPWGEPGYTLYERTTIRPALIVNGISGGYQGPGGKSIIAPSARAKLQFRLVPDQRPEEIDRLVRRHLARVVPATVRHRVRSAPGAKPAVVDRSHVAMTAAARAYERAFGRRPVFVRSGGTIPVVSLLEELYGIPTVMMGFALPTSRIHAPNERFHLPTFFRAIETCIWFFDELARESGESGRSLQHRET